MSSWACQLGARQPDVVVVTPALPTADATAQAAPLFLEISQYVGFVDSFGQLRIAGMLSNPTDVAVSNILLEIEIFDGNNVSLYKGNATSGLRTLAPKETAPFVAVINQELVGASRYEARVINASPADTLQRPSVSADHVLMSVDERGTIHIAGELINNSPNPVQVDSVAAAVYQPDNSLLTSGGAQVVTNYIEPGKSGPFRISINAPAQLPEGFTSQVFIDARFAQALNPAPLSLKPLYYYIDGLNQMHVVGEVTNEGTNPLAVRLMGTFYNAENNVLDATYTDLPFINLAPGETLPYDLSAWQALNTSATLRSVAQSYTVRINEFYSQPSNTPLAVLSTNGNSNTFETTQGVFSGQVVNTSPAPVDNISVLIGFRSKTNGQVIAMGSTTLSGRIAPNESVPYIVRVPIPTPFDTGSAEYFVIAKGSVSP